MRLRGGFTTEDPRLDRLPQWDPRSLRYLATDGIEEKRPRGYTWSLHDRLDQGREGACVGFSITHEALARPGLPLSTMSIPWWEQFARALYRKAQTMDEWEGESYEGTSVLAGMKAAVQLGLFTGYEWAWSVDELVLPVGYKGPAVIGVNWYTGMMTPSSTGLIKPTGRVEGGHAILVNGVNVKNRLFRLTNSWGPRWGLNGQAFLTFDDMARLFDEAGEAAIPVGRKRIAP